MSETAGSKADLPCPSCRSAQVKVALNTAAEIYYLCSNCAHAWFIPKPRPARIRKPPRSKAG